MAREITEICDRCGENVVHKLDARKQSLSSMWEVQVTTKSPAATGFYVCKRKEWCRTCMVQTGLLQYDEVRRAEELRLAGREVNPLPTLEDVIREIAVDAAVEAVNNRS